MIDVAIVTHNTKDLLQQCLETVTGQDGLGRVVVVDDGSTDDTLAMLRSTFGTVAVVATDGNRGFGAAANLAVARCTAPAVLLLNSDTRLNPRALLALAAYIDQHPRAAVVGPRLLNSNGTLQRSCFPFPSLPTALLGETGLGYFLRLIPGVRQRHLRTWPHDRPRIVPWVRGAALALRRDVFGQLGGFDEGFVMYFEETDLAWRMRAAGWEVHFAPVTDVYHVGGGSTNQQRAAMTVRYYRSMEEFYRRHRTPRERSALRALLRSTKWFTLQRDRLRLALPMPDAVRDRVRADVEAWHRIVNGI